MCSTTKLADRRRQLTHLEKQDFSPEEQEVFDEFLRRWQATTDTLGEDLETALRTGQVDLETLEGIRAEVGPRIGDYVDDFEVIFREISEDAAVAGRALEARRFGLDIDFNLVPERTIEVLDDWAVTASQSVSGTLEDEITNYLRGAQEEGLSISEIAEKFQNEYMDERLHGSHANQLARDATVGPSNAGSHSAHEDAEGVVGEEWIAEIDGRQREAHDEADGQIVPVDGTFLVGGEELRYPHDPRGSVGNTTNCRCIAAPVFADDLTEDELEALESGDRIQKTADNGTVKILDNGSTQPLAV